MTLLEACGLVSISLCTVYVLIPAGRDLIFGIASWFRCPHIAPAAALPPAPPIPRSGQQGGSTEGGNHMDKVAQLMGGATVAAEALRGAGMETDDTELAARFIEGMDECHAMFTQIIVRHMAAAKEAGVPESELASVKDAVENAMIESPSFTNVYFLHRLANVIRGQASADVLAAARKVVNCRKAIAECGDDVAAAHIVEDWLDSALAELAASLPKEGL